MIKLINKIIILVLFLHISTTKAETISPSIIISDAISISGHNKYPKGFRNFDFVNPDAPKKGRIVLPAYGTFDNFNPYIFKGTASPEAAALTLDSLGYTPADDPETAYPLIAEKFEQPSDNSFIGFYINPNAKFADNTPITADDVVFSFNALITKGSPVYKFYYADVDKVIKLSPRHVRFYFKPESKNRELPLILSSLKIFSAKVFAT